jgi:hypothetical protein
MPMFAAERGSQRGGHWEINQKTNMKPHILLITAGLVLGATSGALAQGTAFTFQGRLDDGPSPANGSYDLRFSLHNALIGGSQVGSVVTTNGTGVTNGLFTVTLDFGNQFPGTGRWLEIGVRTNGGGVYDTLVPRQSLAATPYAITAGNITGSINGNLITAGSIPDSGLSTNVALRSGGNTFSGPQIINANVGIGTTTPGKLLQVGGASGTEGMIRLHSASATSVAARTWDIGVPKNDTDASGKYYSFVIDDVGFGTEPEFIVKYNSGNVGIGTTNPTAKLDVAGTVKATAFNGDGSALTLSSTVALRSTSNTFNGTQTINGNVGIGTSPSQTYPLAFPSTLGDKISLYGNFGFGIQPSTLQIHSDLAINDVAFGHGPSLDMIETMRIKGNGNVGIGTNSPVAMLTIRQKNTNTHSLLIESAIGSPQLAVYANGQVNVSGPFYALGDAQVWGEVTTTAINITSDRNAKEQFKPVNPREVLDKVAQLPITEWQYRANGEARHIGPMAQDFHQAFGLGRDEKHITSVDADGVALAAIQGLNSKVDERDARIRELEKSVTELKELVHRLTSQAQPSNR